MVEGVENEEMVKKVRRAWGKIYHIVKKDLGKQICTVTISYSAQIKSRVKMIKLSYPWEPSMSFKTIKSSVATISEVDWLKETIKTLEKENDDLWSSLGKVTLDKETLKLNLNQKRERALKADTNVQIKQHKRRKIGEFLKGTYENLAAKKKQLAEAQYRTCKMEINYQNQIRNLQDQLEKFQKGLKEEQDRSKQLEVALS